MQRINRSHKYLFFANFGRQLSQLRDPLLLNKNDLLFYPISPKGVLSAYPWISFLVDGPSQVIVFQMKLCLKEAPPNLRIKMNTSSVSIKLHNLPPLTFKHSVKILSKLIIFLFILNINEANSFSDGVQGTLQVWVSFG